MAIMFYKRIKSYMVLSIFLIMSSEKHVSTHFNFLQCHKNKYTKCLHRLKNINIDFHSVTYIVYFCHILVWYTSKNDKKKFTMSANY